MAIILNPVILTPQENGCHHGWVQTGLIQGGFLDL